MNRFTEPLHLPAPIAAYFSADKRDGTALAQCFTETAVVQDEGHTYNGKLEIEQWKTDTSTKYEYTSEPFACEQKESAIVITSMLTGNFPGSPADLRFIFKLANGRIESLQIVP